MDSAINTTNLTWAFAKDPSRNYRIQKALSGRGVKGYIVSSCSREARALGVRAGMRLGNAKRLVPEIKVLVIGERRV